MQIVIPMSGRGQRFLDAGRRTIKPLIPVDGLPMVEHIVRMFPGESDFLFVCAADHLADTPLRQTLERIAPRGRIVSVEPHKLGPVHAALLAADHIRDDQPVTLNYCDFSVAWDYAHFKRAVETTQCAGAITAYRGFHPHTLGPNLYAYMRQAGDWLVEIREKHAFTADRMNESASSGTYYFRTGDLLKRTFREAVNRGWQTNGEYFASTPYNLLVEQGLPVLVYQLDQFLQWGTPEDLAEYEAWSDYFRTWSGWRPTLPPSAGTNLLPMVGAGVRFQREGYAVPKPLVPVAGVPMVQRSLDTLPPAKRWVAVCRPEHSRHPDFATALTANGRAVDVIEVAALTAGQASTCLLARDRIDPAAPLTIGPCDTAMFYDQDAYARLIADPAVECVVWTFRDHPHANRHPRQYGWVRADADGWINAVSCKQPISATPHRDPGVIGAFWFREARFFLAAADDLIRQGRRVNGEFYADSAVSVLIEHGRRAKLFEVRRMVCFGTPDDVRTFEYWHRYFRAAPHHPYLKGPA